MLITRHFISDNHYVQTQLMTEGEETKHPHYETYQDIRETIEAQ